MVEAPLPTGCCQQEDPVTTTHPTTSDARPLTQRRTSDRVTALTGIAFAVCVLALPGAETSLAPVAGIELAAMTALLLTFVAGTAGRIRRGAVSPESWSTVAVAAATVAVSVKVATGAAGWAARGDVDPAVAEGLQRLNEVGFIAFLTPLGVAVLALGLGCVQHGGLPRWLAWAAVPVGVLLVLNGLFLDATFGPAILLFFLWTVVGGLVVLVRPPSPR